MQRLQFTLQLHPDPISSRCADRSSRFEASISKVFFAVLFWSGNGPKFAFDCKVAYRVLKHLNFEDYSLGWEVPTLWKMFGTCIFRPEGRERSDWAARCAKLVVFFQDSYVKCFADLEFLDVLLFFHFPLIEMKVIASSLTSAVPRIWQIHRPCPVFRKFH